MYTISEIWARRSQPKIAARMAREAGLNITRRELKAANALSFARWKSGEWEDPLVVQSRTRKARLAWKRDAPMRAAREAAAKARWEAERARCEAEKARCEAEKARWEAEKASEKAIRADLMRAARVARKMGYTVDSSTDRSGRISSYYVKSWTCPRTGGQLWRPVTLRVSDHELPWTPRREEMGTPSEVLATDQPHRRDLWWRRAFTLFFAGRCIPDRTFRLEEDGLEPDGQAKMPPGLGPLQGRGPAGKRKRTLRSEFRSTDFVLAFFASICKMIAVIRKASRRKPPVFQLYAKASVRFDAMNPNPVFVFHETCTGVVWGVAHGQTRKEALRAVEHDIDGDRGQTIKTVSESDVVQGDIAVHMVSPEHREEAFRLTADDDIPAHMPRVGFLRVHTPAFPGDA